MQPLLRVEAAPLVGDRRALALTLLSDEERARFGTDPRPERFLTGRMLLRELASGVTGTPLESITIAARCPDCGRQHGRPAIEGSELFVSLSHSHELTVAALIDGTPIGVDIERRAASTERLAAIREVAGGAADGNGDGGDDVRHWTRVEAVLKADGRGLRVDPRAVAIDGDEATLDGVRYALTELRDRANTISVATAI